MSAMQRNKGAAFERKVANLLTEATGTTWRRRVRNQAGDSDVVADEPAFARISIECKHANTLCLPAWWRQAQDQAGEEGVPVLIYRQLRLTYADDPRALRLDLASGVGIERVLRRRSGVSLSQPVPALYTAPVFKEIVTRDSADVVAQFLEEQWVWGAAGAPEVSAAQLAADVTMLYEQDYIDVWERIVNDLEPTAVATVAQPVTNSCLR